MRTKRAQRSFIFRKRKRAKRKRGRPRKPGSGVPHLRRPPISRRTPVHVTTRFKRDVGHMRGFKAFKVLCAAILAANGRLEGFRVVHFSLQGNHLHLIVEAEHESILSKGMQGLNTRLARQFNKLLGRTGTFFADRYHCKVMSTPLVARRVLAYVLNNWRRHKLAKLTQADWVDPFSSARWFDGFVQKPRRSTELCPVSAPHSALLRGAWKIHGLIDVREVPVGEKRQQRSA